MKVREKIINWILAIASFHALTQATFAQTAQTDGLSSNGAAALVDAVVTRQKLFSIPFAVDDQFQRPREIYLFVSGNRGERWSLYQRRPAQDRKFDFQAGQDGEYWFAVGTDTVQINPDGKTKPEKIVVVDTEVPRIHLQVTALRPGRLSARWFAVDDTLSASTFQLTYRTAASPDFKRIDVILPRDQSKEFDGEVSWMVNDTGTIEVRAQIMDRAGNVGSVVRSIPLNGATGREGVATFRRSSASEQATPGRVDLEDERRWALPADRADNTVGLPEQRDETRPFDGNDTDSQSSDYYLDNSSESTNESSPNTSGELIGSRRPLSRSPLGADSAKMDDRTTSLDARQKRPQPGSTAGAVTRYSRWTSDTTKSRDNEAPRQASRRRDDSGISGYEWRDRPSAREPGGYGDDLQTVDSPRIDSDSNALQPDADEQSWDHIYGDSADASALFPADSPTNESQPAESESPAAQVTSSNVFNLDYDVSDLGNADLARVELWMTQNDGTTWQPYGVDEDLQSPFYVEVPNDGVYGFTLLIHASTGQSTLPPQSGDAPDVQIEVDTEKPVAHLTGARFTNASALSPLDIEWQASDKNLSETAITLSYAETVYGPWVIISRNVPNTGRYSWELPDNLPRSVFIQIDVQDRAGNRTVHRLSEPTMTRPSNPRAIIKSIRTTSN